MKELRDAIYSQLSGGTALTSALGGTAIYHLHAPEGAALPYVVFGWQGGGDLNIDPNETNESVQFVRVYAATDAEQLADFLGCKESHAATPVIIGLGQYHVCTVCVSGRISIHSVGQTSKHFSQPVQASANTA